MAPKPHNEDKPFLFNMNIFDDVEEQVEEPEEEAPPLPPLFSQEALDRAKKEAFAQGRQQALSEAKDSQEQKISQILEKISQGALQLFLEEDKRNDLYEKESANLCLAIFKKLFPLYHDHCGFEELQKTILDVLKKQRMQKEIILRISSELSKDIEQRLSAFQAKNTNINLIIQPDESLSPGICDLSWRDGGAHKDIPALAQEIETLIEQILAAKGATGHDKVEDVNISQTEEMGSPQ